MAEQERKQAPTPARQEEIDENAPVEQADELTEKIDDLLDEIDSVLEENAEEFVKNYVQKGGE
ncbi:MAG: ubiquitin-like protein Pup [Acidimicrobiia bacterium]